MLRIAVYLEDAALVDSKQAQQKLVSADRI
jgi:hypothetical protein